MCITIKANVILAKIVCVCAHAVYENFITLSIFQTVESVYMHFVFSKEVLS